MKAISKHLIKQTLEYTLKFKPTPEQRTKHVLNLIDEHIKAKLALGTLTNDEYSIGLYRLSLMKAIQANANEVINDEIAIVDTQIEEMKK